MPLFLKPGEKDDFGINFGARTIGAGQSASAYGWWVPANISAVASALSGSAITVRLGFASAGWVYAVSGYVDLYNGKRLIDVINVHVG